MKVRLLLKIVILVLCANFLHAESFLDLISKKDNFFLNVVEKTSINGKTKEKEYNVKIKISENRLFKEMILPKINKGEIYSYYGEKKKVYYPMLNQIVEKDLENEENYLMKVLKDIKKIETKNIVEHKYIDNDKIVLFDEKNESVTKIKYNDETSLELLNYKNNFPGKINIYDGDKLISEISIKKTEFNISYGAKDFEIVKNKP